MTAITRYKYVIILLFTMSILISCMRDDLSDCYATVRITFAFEGLDAEKPGYGIDTKEIGNMYVYLFDKNDVLAYIYKEDNITFSKDYSMQIPDIRTGEYRFIAWGNQTDHYVTEPVARTGTTTFGELCMRIEHIEEMSTDINSLNPLFYGSHEGNFIKCTAANINTVQLKLIRDNFDIYATFKGFNPVEEHEYICTISDNNGTYSFANAYITSETINYRALCERNEKTELLSGIRVMRIDENRSPRLTLTNKTINEEIFTVNIIPEILALEAKGITADFEYQYVYRIEFEKSINGEIFITINGWKVNEGGGVLEP